MPWAKVTPSGGWTACSAIGMQPPPRTSPCMNHTCTVDRENRSHRRIGLDRPCADPIFSAAGEEVHSWRRQSAGSYLIAHSISRRGRRSPCGREHRRRWTPEKEKQNSQKPRPRHAIALSDACRTPPAESARLCIRPSVATARAATEISTSKARPAKVFWPSRRALGSGDRTGKQAGNSRGPVAVRDHPQPLRRSFEIDAGSPIDSGWADVSATAGSIGVGSRSMTRSARFCTPSARNRWQARERRFSRRHDECGVYGLLGGSPPSACDCTFAG